MINDLFSNYFDLLTICISPWPQNNQLADCIFGSSVIWSFQWFALMNEWVNNINLIAAQPNLYDKNKNA